MKRIYSTGAALLGILLVVAILAIATYPRLKRIEKHGPPPISVSSTLPGNAETVGASIAAQFNDWSDFTSANPQGRYQNKFPSSSPWSHFFIFQKIDTQRLFPSDEEILLDRGADSFVKSYLQIPAALRTHDVFLYEPSGDYYWPSEYFYNRQPAKFRCSFIIHLEPALASATKVEIFEYQPTAWVGEYVGLSAHAVLPARLHDIRPVEATTVERQSLLEMIEAARRSGR